MKQYRANGIIWETDPYDMFSQELPQTAVVWTENEDGVADALTDEYGWCVQSIEEIYEIPQH